MLLEDCEENPEDLVKGENLVIVPAGLAIEEFLENKDHLEMMV